MSLPWFFFRSTPPSNLSGLTACLWRLFLKVFFPPSPCRCRQGPPFSGCPWFVIYLETPREGAFTVVPRFRGRSSHDAVPSSLGELFLLRSRFDQPLSRSIGPLSGDVGASVFFFFPGRDLASPVFGWSGTVGNPPSLQSPLGSPGLAFGVLRPCLKPVLRAHVETPFFPPSSPSADEFEPPGSAPLLGRKCSSEITPRFVCPVAPFFSSSARCSLLCFTAPWWWFLWPWSSSFFLAARLQRKHSGGFFGIAGLVAAPAFFFHQQISVSFVNYCCLFFLPGVLPTVVVGPGRCRKNVSFRVPFFFWRGFLVPSLFQVGLCWASSLFFNLFPLS